MSSNNPSPPLTDEQRRRAESNRLRALAKRKSFLQHNQTTNPSWRISKCPKLEDEVQQGKGEGEERERFRVRLEICGPDSFSIATEAVKGEVYRDEECLTRIEGLLFDLMPTHYTQVLDGGKASVYKLKDYVVILKCLKSSKGIEVEEIPWTTYNVLEKLSHSYIVGKWMPCRPEHLSDEEVGELIAKLPRKLAERLLPFQLDGVKFGLQRGGRCLIADEMGLGKTLQAIAIASCFASEGSILVVCPAILRYSWAEELERWLPCCLPVDIHLVFGHENNPIHLPRCPKVVVISYKMLQHLRKSIVELEWTVLIVDESHHVRCTKKKSENGEVKAVLDVATKARHIILLSGTPSLSRPFDIFHQVNMLWPGLLGKHKYEFAKTYCSVKFFHGSDGKVFQDFSRGTRLEELNILLRQTIMIRRLKEHLLVQLPPKRRQIITLSLKRSDIIEAKNAVGVLRDSLVANDDGQEKPLERFPEEKEGGIRRSLKKLTAQELGIAKVSGFIEWLSFHPIVAESDGSRDADVNHVSDKMIIFAHHHKVLDRVQEFICQKVIGFIRIDKDTLDCDRQSAVQSFQSSKEVKVAMIGIKVGYAGLNLSAARSVVFLELPQAPTTLLQAEDRAHRRGQTNAVNIYIFCGKDTSDELSWKKLNRSLQRVSTTTDGKYDAVQQIAVDSVNCLESWGNADRGTYESHNISVPVGEEGDQFLDNAAGNDVTADKDDALGEVDTRPDDALESCRPIPPASLRFAVSKYTGRIHLCTCIPGVDLRPRPLYENFQPDEISADPDDKEASPFIKSNPEWLEAILTFINDWKNLRPFDRRKLLGKPLQLPLSTELMCLNESANHDSRGLLNGGSKRRTTPFSDISFPLPSDASWKDIHLSGSYAKQDRTYIQAWSMTDEPLCKLCQNPCNGANAKKPEYFEDLFCKLACYEEYRSRTSNSFLRQELFEVERGICRNCKLDCHKLVKHLKPLSHANRELYIEKVAPNLVKHKKLLDKLVCDPTEGNAWHADHLVPVYLGGGECRVENMRTLCVACHADVTAAQCADRGLARKHLKKVMKNLQKCKRQHKDPGCSIIDDDALLVNVPGSAYSEMKEVETKETVTESESLSEINRPAAQSTGVNDKGSNAFSIFLYNAKM